MVVTLVVCGGGLTGCTEVDYSGYRRIGGSGNQTAGGAGGGTTTAGFKYQGGHGVSAGGGGGGGYYGGGSGGVSDCHVAGGGGGSGYIGGCIAINSASYTLPGSLGINAVNGIPLPPATSNPS